MAMVKCPYCNQQVDESYIDSRCPLCNKIVMSEDYKAKRVNSILRYSNKINRYERLKTFVWNDELAEATEELRFILEGEDAVMESAVIEKIIQNRPSNWLRSEVPDMIDEATKPSFVKLTACSACNHQISIKAEMCPQCGNPTGVHVCPKCGSINTKTISGASKATSVFLWGPFATNKVMSKYQCKDCWHKF